jgi:peptide/nickel transport system permease protein
VSPNPDLGCGGARDWLSHLILPAITLGLFFAGVYTRIVRAGVAQVLGEQKAELRRKLSRRFVLVMARIVGRDIGFVLGVAFLVEVIFVIPGLGRSALIFAVDQYDSITLQAIILYTTGLAIAVHFVIDVIVAALDPDLRAEWPIAGMPKPT